MIQSPIFIFFCTPPIPGGLPTHVRTRRHHQSSILPPPSPARDLQHTHTLPFIFIFFSQFHTHTLHYIL
ncbi:hypothetical protein L6452_13307 [Arctium lappa]|uniref:Uncharacterized protein n=1 Tax=Arctium lappa TaxID=4217 RepID=A0ACB9CHX2_ARCLA|nr:hypothetical protein L6452_13307 [Arctium lappa]